VDVPLSGAKNGQKTGIMFNIAAKNAGGIGIMRRIFPEDSSFGKISLPK
jgi:hypothetical protein